MKKTNYWAVTAKCGHVGGVTKYIPITFYIYANTKKEASDIAIAIPRVKHDNKYVILGIRNISYDAYIEGRIENSNDPYLKCKNPRQQKLIVDEISGRLFDEDDPRCIKKAERFCNRLHKRKDRSINRKRISKMYNDFRFADWDMYGLQFA